MAATMTTTMAATTTPSTRALSPPNRTVPQLILALRTRATARSDSEWTATAEMMREAADHLERMQASVQRADIARGTPARQPRGALAVSSRVRDALVTVSRRVREEWRTVRARVQRAHQAGVAFLAEHWYATDTPMIAISVEAPPMRQAPPPAVARLDPVSPPIPDLDEFPLEDALFPPERQPPRVETVMAAPMSVTQIEIVESGAPTPLWLHLCAPGSPTPRVGETIVLPAGETRYTVVEVEHRLHDPSSQSRLVLFVDRVEAAPPLGTGTG